MSARHAPAEATELRDGDLVLRAPHERDVPAIVAACGDPEIPRFIPLIPSPYTVQDGLAYVAAARELWSTGQSRPFVILDAGTGALLGSVGVGIGVRPAVGYWLAPHARGRGVATRAVSMVVDWARREHGVRRIELYTHPDNVASQRVAERVGFRRVGSIVHDPPFEDGTTEAFRYELDR